MVFLSTSEMVSYPEREGSTILIFFQYHISETAQPDNVTIATYIMPLHSEKSELTIDITNILGNILYPFSVSFLFPVSITTPT